MEPVVMLSLLGSLIKELEPIKWPIILGTAAIFCVATTAVICLCGGPIGWAVGIGLCMGTVAGFGMWMMFQKSKPSVQPVFTYSVEISFAFTPGEDHLALPYQCRVYNTTTTTKTWSKRRFKTSKTSNYRLIKAKDGREFQQKFEAELENLAREEARSGGKKPIKSISLYDEPYPGETPLDMMRIECEEHFPEKHFVEYPYEYGKRR